MEFILCVLIFIGCVFIYIKITKIERERQRKFEEILKSRKANNDGQIPIILEFSQEVLRGDWRPPSYYEAVGVDVTHEEIMQECRRRIIKAGYIPNEWWIKNHCPWF